MNSYKEVLAYIKTNKTRVKSIELIDGLPEVISFALSVVAITFQKDHIDVINDYADIRV